MNENVLKLTTESWERDVLQSKTPVLVDFWAEWCAPCRAIGPTIDAVAQEFSGRASVGKLNVDDHPEIGAKYGVRSIPTLLVFKGGQVVEQRIGALPKAELVKLLESHAGAAVATPAS